MCNTVSLVCVCVCSGEFAGYKKATAVTALHSRTGRRLQGQEVEQFQAAEDKKELELIQVIKTCSPVCRLCSKD